MRTQSAVQFFFARAGFSYQPNTETRTQGRWRCARELAKAEQAARERGWSFRWVFDHHFDASDFASEEEGGWSDEEKAAMVGYGCVMVDRDGEQLGSLWGITLADNSLADPYCRVVEAELASEALA